MLAHKKSWAAKLILVLEIIWLISAHDYHALEVITVSRKERVQETKRAEALGF